MGTLPQLRCGGWGRCHGGFGDRHTSYDRYFHYVAASSRSRHDCRSGKRITKFWLEGFAYETHYITTAADL